VREVATRHGAKHRRAAVPDFVDCPPSIRSPTPQALVEVRISNDVAGLEATLNAVSMVSVATPISKGKVCAVTS